MHFSDVEGRALHGLIEDVSKDIVIRLDRAGFILHASENASELGLDLSSLLLMPHIADLAAPDHSPEVARYVAQVFAGEARPQWLEFPLHVPAGVEEEYGESEQDYTRWYALNLRLIDNDDGAPQGALGLLHSVEHERRLESEMAARTLVDPNTGLANRYAFCASLRRTISDGANSAIAIFAVDRMRALFMQYGQQTADEILWGFGRFLETMALPGQELAQLDDERFGMLLPQMSVRAAREWAADVLHTFAGLTLANNGRGPELTASAGLARVEMGVDWTLRQAELGLVMARAAGGMQTGICGQPIRAVTSGAAVEQAMKEAVSRAEGKRASGTDF